MHRIVAFLAAVTLTSVACADKGGAAPEPPRTSSFALTVPESAIVGEPFTLTVTAVASDGTSPDPSFNGTVELTASAGTLTLNAVDLQGGVGGATIAVFGASGRITLTARAAGGASRTGTASLDVVPAGAAGLQITSDTAFMLTAPGDTARASAMVYRPDGSADPGVAISWTTSDPGVVQVDANGVITAAADVGSATVIASADGYAPRTVSVVVAQPAAGTHVIPASLVTAMSSDGAQATLANTAVTAAIAVGDIVVSSAGIIARVTAVNAGADAIVLTLEPARLNEAFRRLEISGSSTDMAIEANMAQGGITLYSLSGRFTPETFPLGALECTREGGGEASFDFSGGEIEIESNPQIFFEYVIDATISLDSLAMYVSDEPSIGISSATLALKAETNGSIQCMYALPVDLNIPVATFFGIVTVTGRLAPSIGFQVESSASGEVKVSTPSPKAGVRLKLGAHYDGTIEEWSMIREHEPFVETGSLGDFTDEVTATFEAAVAVPLVEIDGGVNLKVGPADAVGLDFVKPKLFGNFSIELAHPVTPAQRAYQGPSWDLSVKGEADISIKLTGAIADALEYFGVEASYEEPGFELFSIPIVNSPEVTVSAVQGTGGTVELSATAPDTYAGSRVQFWAFAEGEETATSIAEATLGSAGTAEAEWRIPDDGGSYEIVAYLYGSPFSAIDLPYPSELTEISADSVRVSIAPGRAVVKTGDSKQFTATVAGTTNTAVTWRVEGNGGIDGSGLFTAGPPYSARVIVTSVADPSKSDTAQVSITPHRCEPDACEGDEHDSNSSASSSGDPHLTTFDGVPYDFMASGDFMLVKSTVPGDPFEVQTRYRKPNVADRWSWNNAVAMNVGGDTVEVYSTSAGGMELVINGDVAAGVDGVNETLPNGGIVLIDGTLLTVSWPDRTVVSVSPATWESNVLASVRVFLPESRFGAVEGLFGDNDADPANDIRVRGGAVVDPESDALYLEYRQSWRVPYGTAGSLFSRGPDPWDPLFPPGRISIGHLDAAAVTAARAVCADVGIIHPSVADACAFDIVLTGDEEWALIALGIDPAVLGTRIMPAGMVLSAGESRAFGAVVSGTENRAVSWTATGGTIAQNGGNLMTYTAPGEPGTYTVTAALAEDPSVTSTAVVRVVRDFEGSVWTGELDTNWYNAGNWLPAGVPAATDDVLIPAGAPRLPLLGGNPTVRNFTLEAGTFGLDIRTLTVTGNAVSHGTFSGSGRVQMTGPGATVEGTFSKLRIDGTSESVVVTASGPLAVSDSLIVAGYATLDLGGQSVHAENAFRVTGRAKLAMQDPAGVLRVSNVAEFGGQSTAGLLTAGTIVIEKSFIQKRGSGGCCTSFPTSFQPSGTHTVVLSGAGPHSISFNSGGITASTSHFRTLRVETSGSVSIDGSVAVADSLLVTGAATIAGPGTLELAGVTSTVAGSAIATAGVVLHGATAIAGTFSPDTTWFDTRHGVMQGGLDYRNGVVRDTISFATDARFTGDLSVIGTGRLSVGARTITVDGAFTTKSEGELTMQDAAGVLRVVGDAWFEGNNTTGLLTAGTLEVAGDFTQVPSGRGCCDADRASFQAVPAHAVVLNGPAAQRVEMMDAGLTGETSRFGTLRIENPATVEIVEAAVSGPLELAATGTVDGAGLLEVAGTLTSVPGSELLVDRIVLYGAMDLDGAFSPDTVTFEGTGQQIQGGLGYQHIIVHDTVAFTGDADVSGDVLVNGFGILDIGGHTVTIAGALHTDEVGKLKMQDAAGVLRIGGTALFEGGETNGLLTAGVIEAGGDFIQRRGSRGCCTGYPRSFQGSGAHTVVLTGSGAQTVDFQSGGLGSDEPRFATLRISATSQASFLGATGVGADLDLLGQMTVPVGATVTIGGTLHLRSASVLDNQGAVEVTTCNKEAGHSITGIDPCT